MRAYALLYGADRLYGALHDLLRANLGQRGDGAAASARRVVRDRARGGFGRNAQG
jgi:hypothetical protein